VQKSPIAHRCSELWLMTPFKRGHTSGLTRSFRHFSSELLLLLPSSRLACEVALEAYERFLHVSAEA
jgi:hypothetical protein